MRQTNCACFLVSQASIFNTAYSTLRRLARENPCGIVAERVVRTRALTGAVAVIVVQLSQFSVSRRHVF